MRADAGRSIDTSTSALRKEDELDEDRICAYRLLILKIVHRRGALVKLIIFAVSLAVVPLSTYYGSQRLIWNGEPLDGLRKDPKS